MRPQEERAGQMQKLGTRPFGVEAIFTSYSDAGGIFF